MAHIAFTVPFHLYSLWKSRCFVHKIITVGHTALGDESMKGSKDLLSSIIKTTQMGQVGIHAVLKAPLGASLRSALNSQLKEYDTLEQEAQSLAASRGWELEELDSGLRAMVGLMSRAQLAFGDTDYKVAAMTIQGNTKGIIKGLHNLHQFNHSDERISALSQKLLDCESANIRQMQGFL